MITIKFRETLVALLLVGLSCLPFVLIEEEENENKTLKAETRHYESERTDEHHKIRVFKHETWYGDTMLVTIDTTYFKETY